MKRSNALLLLQWEDPSSVPQNAFWMQIYPFQALVREECDLFLNMQKQIDFFIGQILLEIGTLYYCKPQVQG